MKSKRELKENLVLSSWIKYAAFLLVLVFPTSTKAEITIGGEEIPPGSAAYVEDKVILDDIGLPGPGAFCYDHRANAILITAASRADARCELYMKYELEKQKVKYEFKIEKLNIRIQSLAEQHQQIMDIKNKEVERLTAAALKRPNDYVAFWAAGGLLTGIASSVLFIYMTK